MKKILNIRPIFILFVSMIIGALFVPKVLSGNVVCIVLLCVICAILLVFCFAKKVRNVFIVALCGVLFAFGISSVIVKVKDNYKNDIYNAKIVAISTDSIVEDGAKTTVVFRSVKINGEKRAGKLQVVFDEVITFNAGDRVSFEGNIYGISVLQNGRINKSVFAGEVNGRVYYPKILSFEEKNPNVFESIRISVRTSMNKSIKSENACQIGYSVLFGDKSFLGDNVQNNFKLAGGAHLLAVSGLHVGFLVLLLSGLLKLLRCGRKTKFAVLNLFLIFFCFLCGFAPSIVRASLMVFAFTLADLLGKEKDSLNTLSFAGALILLLSPLSVFNASFTLSFACLFGIICLFRPLKKLFIKLRFKEWFSSAAATTLAVSISTFFLCVFYFNSFIYVSLVSNLVLIPLFSIYYFVLFVSSFIVLIIPAFSPILIVSELLFNALYYFVLIFKEIPPLILHSNSHMVLFSLFAVFCASSFVVIKAKNKAIICGALATIIVLTSVFTNIPFKNKNDRVYIDKGFVSVMASSENKTVGIVQTLDDYSFDKLKKLTNKSQLAMPNKIIVFGKQSESELNYYTKNYNGEIITIGDFSSSQNMITSLSSGEEKQFGNINIKAFCVGEYSHFLSVSLGEIKIVIANEIATQNDCNFIQATNDYDLAIVGELNQNLSYSILANKIITKYYENKIDNVFDTNLCQFCLKSENNVLKFKEVV